MKLDLRKFGPTIIIIAAVLLMVAANLTAVQNAVNQIYDFCADNFGWLFIIVNLCAIAFSLWIVFGPYASVRLGGDEAKPSYSTFSWSSMMFTTGCSIGLIIFSFLEPIYYVASPPFQISPFSVKAYEYAAMYPHFHWGINCWALSVPISVAIAYMMYNRHKKQVTLSVACEPVLKKRSNGILGHIVDIIGTFGAVVAPVTSMGIGMPLLILLFREIFDIPVQYEPILQIIILLIWILIFGTSVYLGINKGIKNLSNTNVMLDVIFILFVGALAGFTHIFRAEINSLGLYVSNIVRMSCYTDPFGDGSFVKSWSIWYLAWGCVYMPLMGIFSAKISKGRTLRELALGLMGWCSAGCFLSIMTLGNYSLKIQKSGIVDVAAVLGNEGQAKAILEIIKTMPFPKVMMVILTILSFVFMATTVDSSSFVAAESTIKNENADALAPRWCRVLWASIACCITLVLLKVGGFNVVQLLTIIIGMPLAIVVVVLIFSAMRMLREDILKQDRK